MKYDTHVNITSLHHAFSQNYEWLESVASLSDNNRFAGVKSRLEEIARNYDASTNQVTKDFQLTEALLTAFEAKRFNQAVGYLRTFNRHHLPIDKIRSMCEGPAYHFEEIPASSNAQGRNIQFEFILGGELKKRGFRTIQEFDDIKIDYASSLIRYECKRLSTSKNFATRFSEAIDQLATKVGKHRDEYGIIALSIEKTDKFDQNFFRGNDINEARDRLNQHKNNVLGTLRESLRIPSDKKILGVYLFASTLLWNESAGTFIDVSNLYTEMAIQVPATPLHDCLFNAIKQELEKD
jgi:hypothetical protein